MTLLNMIEEIKQSFPEISEAQIKIELNRRYREFAHRTRLIKATYNLTLTTATSYSLAADVDSVYDVFQFDASGDSVVEPMKCRIDNGTIYFYDYYGNELDELESNSATITIKYYKIPTELSLDTDAPTLPSHFHEALVSGALSSMYAKFPTETILPNGNVGKIVNLNLAKYWENQFEKQVLDGKRHSNINGNSL